MTSQRINHINVLVDYKEESVRLPAALTILLLILVTTPLVLWVLNVNKLGLQTADIGGISIVVEKVEADVKMVDAMLRNDADALAAIRDAQNAPVVTLIVPEVVILEEGNPSGSPAKLNVQLDGIYWSPSNPLVSINKETYRVGDIVQGHEIVSIGKTSVQLQSSDGTIIVKDMYENLLSGERK